MKIKSNEKQLIFKHNNNHCCHEKIKYGGHYGKKIQIRREECPSGINGTK